MAKVLFIVASLLLFLTLASDATTEPAEDHEDEVAYAENYGFLLELIDQYDYNGQGAIKKEEYGDFLYKVITQGSEQENVRITEFVALRSAVDKFAEEKKTQDIGKNAE